jgi:hypothetical protein
MHPHVFLRLFRIRLELDYIVWCYQAQKACPRHSQEGKERKKEKSHQHRKFLAPLPPTHGVCAEEGRGGRKKESSTSPVLLHPHHLAQVKLTGPKVARVE